MAAIVIVIIVCASGVGIVELQLSSANSGRHDVSTSTVTVTVTQTAQSSLGVAQVAVTAANLRSADFLYTNPLIYFTCGSAAGSFLTLSNTGTAGTSVTAATINWAGQTNSYTLADRSTCLLGAAGSGTETQNVLFSTTTKLLRDATAGGTFSGSVTLDSGAVLIFTGTFQGCQGCAPYVVVTGGSLISADFLSTNTVTTFTCGTAGGGSFLMLSNTGSVGTSVTGATINWAGQTNSYAVAAGESCLVGAAGSGSETRNLRFASTTKLLTSATAGGTYTGSVTLASGAVLLFTGTFQGCQGCAPQVAVTAASLRSSDFLTTNAGTTFTCGSASGSFLTLSNTGTAGVSITSATINWAGQTNSYSLATGSSCFVGAAGSASATQNVLFAQMKLYTTSATAGGTFTGSVTLSSGAVLIFTGTFQ